MGTETDYLLHTFSSAPPFHPPGSYSSSSSCPTLYAWIWEHSSVPYLQALSLLIQSHTLLQIHFRRPCSNYCPPLVFHCLAWYSWPGSTLSKALFPATTATLAKVGNLNVSWTQIAISHICASAQSIFPRLTMTTSPPLLRITICAALYHSQRTSFCIVIFNPHNRPSKKLLLFLRSPLCSEVKWLAQRSQRQWISWSKSHGLLIKPLSLPHLSRPNSNGTENNAEHIKDSYCNNYHLNRSIFILAGTVH